MSVKMKKNKYSVDKQIDNIRLYNRYKLLALNMFKWENLPQGLYSRDIERFLYEYGQVVFFEHKHYGLLCLPCTSIGTPNIYGNDVYVQAQGFGETFTIRLIDSLKSRIVQDSTYEGVRVCNNDLMTPMYIDVVDYANKMNEVEKAIDLNVKQQKFPYIIFSNSNKQFSLEVLMDKIENGYPVIYADNKISFDDLQCFNTNVPFVTDKLQDYKKELDQEILNYFALSSSMNKRERMLVSEIDVNNDFKNRTCELMYKERNDSIEIVNEVFGTNIEVLKMNDIVEDNVSRETMEGSGNNE